MIPRQLPSCTGWRLASHYQPAREVGGDFLDAFDLPTRPTHLAVHVGDVTGKGIAASLLMAFSRAVLRSAGYNGAGPADTLARANRVLATEVPSSLFLTAIALELDPSGTVRWSSAGHEPPFLLRAGSANVLELGATAPILGLFPVLDAKDEHEQLGPGDRLVLWTDGITDAQRPDGARFGEARLRSVLAAHAPCGDPETLVADLLDAVAAWTAGAEPADDVTLVVVERAS